MATFENKYYKKEWKEFSSIKGNPRFADGTYFKEGDKYAVYDGATNIMGYVNKNGNFELLDPKDAESEYKCSFLKAAKEALVAEGLVFGR